MASYGLWMAVSIVVLCTLFSDVMSLQCYNCTSGADKNCGKTWGYSKDDEQAKKYLVTCTGTTVACQKLESDGAMEGYLVTRRCWSSDSMEHFTPKDECEEFHNGMVCYCKNEGDEPCNGKQLLQPQIAVILLGLSALLRRFVL